ncbi:MAG: hypothetical protein LOX97_02235, partial [Sphingomonas sp.]|nr:hypothetical protein [Sphingomonas sp.]
MLDMRAKWRNELAIAGGARPSPKFGRRRKSWRDLDLVVDLAIEPLSKRWWGGGATLTALFALVAYIAPAPFEPLPVQGAHLSSAEARQFRDLSVKSIAEGSTTGVRMAANGLVRPLAQAPDRPFVELFAKLGEGDSIEKLLARSGVSYAEAGEAARVISSAVPGIIEGTSIAIRLGRRTASGVRPVERIAFRHGIDLNVVVTAGAAGLTAATSRLAVSRPSMEMVPD